MKVKYVRDMLIHDFDVFRWILRTPIERIGEAAVRAMVRAHESGGRRRPAGTMLIQPFELFTPENV